MTTAVDNVVERPTTYKLRPYQMAFMTSEARYPSMVCGWGTGKSLCLIMKALKAAKDYPNNLVLIVRYSFTDLRDSTMRDFTRYTGIDIPSNKDVVLANGSTIMFRHGSELATLQNINLGSFLIEQAEEFSSASEFHMLRGRLRREGVPHFGAVIANAQGHNWVWNLWERHNPGRSSEYKQWYATTFNNGKNLPGDFLEDLRRMEQDSPAKYAQYVMNSRDELDVEGSYYARLIGEARTAKRIGHVPYDPNALVYTFWDVGVSDSTAIWFTQFIGKEIHDIEYYENSGESIHHYVKLLQDRPYIYADNAHWGPHDLMARQFSQEGTLTTWDVAKDLGVTFNIVNRHRVQDGIEAVRGILPKCWMDEDKCQKGIEALEHYQRRKNESLSNDERATFSDAPLHDWASHCSDAKRYQAMTYRFQLVVSDERIGYPNPLRAVDDSVFDNSYNALTFGIRGR